MRLYSSHSGLTLNKIRSGKLNETEMASLYAAKTKLDRFNLYLDEAGATDVEELVTVCRKLKRDGKLDLEMCIRDRSYSRQTQDAAR